MRWRGNLIASFFIFLCICLLLFALAKNSLITGFTGFLEQLTVPLQRTVFITFSGVSKQDQTSEAKLREENKKLLIQLAKQKEIEKENRALRDQFDTTSVPSRKLLPAKIIGRPSFIPGESSVTEIVIDKGKDEGIKPGTVVVYKDAIVGKIVHVSSHLATVRLVTHIDTLFTAQALKTSALGVIKGQGGATMLLANVVLSDKLEKGDMVVTKGDVDKNGSGFPPDLVVGKIISVKKIPSALFQVAEVRSLVDFAKMETVFILR